MRKTLYSTPAIILACFIGVAGAILENPEGLADYFRIVGMGMTFLAIIYVGMVWYSLKDSPIPTRAGWLMAALEFLLFTNIGNIQARFHHPFVWWGTPGAFLGALCVVIYIFIRYTPSAPRDERTRTRR